MNIQFVLLSLLRSLWFMLPLFGNSAPVLIRGKFNFLAVPVDLNKTWKGKPIFGKNKTFRGVIVCCLASTLIFALQKLLYQFDLFRAISLIDYSQYGLLLGFLLGFGAIFGDLVKSFFKRRLEIPPGKPWFPFDQIDYTLGALAFASIIYLPDWWVWLIIIGSGIIFHVLINYLGFLLKVKETKF